MVPYTEKRRSTTAHTTSTSSVSSSGTLGPYDNYYHEGDSSWWTYSSLEPLSEALPPLLKEKPKFDRVMKMRNTDGRPIKYRTWKPVRMLNGRNNIGVRNYKKMG